MIKILHILSSLDNGGVESLLKQYYLNIDNDKIKFDFIVHGKNIGMLEEEFKNYGSRIYHVTPKKESFIKNYKEINRIIKNGKYDIVHCHQNFTSFPTLYSAWIHKVKVRIIHSHGCVVKLKKITKFKNFFFRILNKIFVNYFFACSLEAGKYLYGKKWSVDNRKNFIMYNAISVEKFQYNVNERKKYREDFKNNDKIVLLHVGRFSKEKNHEFLLNIIENLEEPTKYILYLVGDGIEKKEIEQEINNRNLNNVITLGKRDDVNSLMCMSDMLLLPSLNEGLGIVLIEAQINKLFCIASDSVPKETQISDKIRYLNLEDINEWINEIKECKFNRSENILNNRSRDYDIKNMAKEYEKFIYKITKE